MARVNYAKPVSDEHLKTVLQRMANFFNKDVNVHSGDRNFVPRGGSRRSLHLAHRAADLHVAGMTDAEVYNSLRANTGSIFDRTQGYEVIRHGIHTETGGPHIHIGHYGGNGHAGQVLFKLEGLAPPGGHYDVTPQAIASGTPATGNTPPTSGGGGGTTQRPPQSRPAPTSTGGGSTAPSPARSGRATIRAAVGRGGLNRGDDVETVQMLLNRARRRMRQAGGAANVYPPLREDRICGPRTLRAIYLFQRFIARFRQPDSRVDPGGRTLRLLNVANTGVPQSTNTRVRQEVNTPPPTTTGRVVTNPNASPAELLADPRVRAMLEVLAFTEGTGDDYGKVVNGVVERAPIYPQYIGRRNVSITDLSRHPQLYVRWARGQPLSSAAGRYQFLYSTWTSVGQGDFGRQSQDVGAVILMKRRNMIAPLLRDDLEQTVFRGAPEWASLPKNARNEGYYSGQSARTLDQIRARYTQALARFGR